MKKKNRCRWPTIVIRQARKMFGIKLTREDLEEFARQIRIGDALLLDRLSKNIMLYMVTLPGSSMKQARVRYSTRKSRILAFVGPGDF